MVGDGFGSICGGVKEDTLEIANEGIVCDHAVLGDDSWLLVIVVG